MSRVANSVSKNGGAKTGRSFSPLSSFAHGWLLLSFGGFEEVCPDAPKAIKHNAPSIVRKQRMNLEARDNLDWTLRRLTARNGIQRVTSELSEIAERLC